MMDGILTPVDFALSGLFRILHPSTNVTSKGARKINLDLQTPTEWFPKIWESLFYRFIFTGLFFRPPLGGRKKYAFCNRKHKLRSHFKFLEHPTVMINTCNQINQLSKHSVISLRSSLQFYLNWQWFEKSWSADIPAVETGRPGLKLFLRPSYFYGQIAMSEIEQN